MPKIKCLLVDDHTLFRQGVRRLLEMESDFEVVGEAADAGAAVEKARDLRPDIVLMDIGMQGLSSFEAARHIRKNRPETKVLFLTMYEDEDYLVQCLEVGAAGYVLKDTPAPQLVTAIRDVYKGGKYLSTQVLGKLVEDFRSRVRDQKMRPRMSTLTPREREILKLLAEGNSVKEIAVLLGLSVKTIEAHKFNLMRKLDIHNKAQLVTYAIQKKIIKIPVNQSTGSFSGTGGESRPFYLVAISARVFRSGTSRPGVAATFFVAPGLPPRRFTQTFAMPSAFAGATS